MQKDKTRKKFGTIKLFIYLCGLKILIKDAYEEKQLFV